MKAMTLQAFNTAPTVQELLDPVPSDGEVVVDVSASSINAMDVLIWRGMIEGQMPYQLPVTLGQDVAGTVSAIGPGVTDLAVGDRVYGVHLNLPFHRGTLAEQVAISAAQVTRIPTGLELAAAGALGLAGTAATTAVEAAALIPDDVVLVSGATGGVGSFAVQLATYTGARVVATAVGQDQVDFVRGLGADDVIDHTADLRTQVNGLGITSFDAIIHLAGDPTPLADVCTQGARFVSTIGWGLEILGERDLQVTGVMATPTRGVLDSLADAVSVGTLSVPITRTYSIDQGPRALEDFTSGALGKFGVTIA